MEYTVSEIANILNVEIQNKSFSGLKLIYPEIDSRHIMNAESSLFFALKGSQFDGHYFIPELKKRGVKVFVVSESYSVDDDEICLLKVYDVLEALQKLASYHRSRFNIPVIGITGSNGKTIVKEWLSVLLHPVFSICKNPKSFNSQLGVALSVLELNTSHQLAIFEAGISKPGEMSKLREIIQPTMGILTNIGDAHQAGFSGIFEKTREKLSLFDSVSKLVYCKDYESADYLRQHHLNNVNWSWKYDADYQLTKFSRIPEGSEIEVIHRNCSYRFRLSFHDDASVENALHCIIVSIELGLHQDQIQKGLEQLCSLSMRLEQKEGINGCILINDSYSLDLKSLQLALQFVDQQNHQLPRTLILTDFAEQEGTKELWASVAYLLTKYRIQKLIAVGSHVRNLQPFLAEELEYFWFDSVEKFIDKINTLYFKDELIVIKGARKFQLERVFNLLSLSKHDTILEIDLKAVTHNLQIYRSLLKKETKLMAVVKAAAYGSGHYEIARLLEHKNVDYLAVAYPDEGIILRQKGITTPILVMNTGTADFASLLDYRLEPEIFSLHQCNRLIRETGSIAIVRIHLKFDTGMHRLGFLEEDLDELIQLLRLNPQLQVVSIFSHLSGSDNEIFDEFTRRQAALFEKMTSRVMRETGIKPLLHLLNGGGVARHPGLQYDMIRLGIGMYGIDSDPRISQQLEKVHTLKTRVTQIKHYRPGESVSYNRSGKLQTETNVAVLSIGYADGLPRNAGLKSYAVWCNKKRHPLIGLVCMDMCMVDLSKAENIQEGSEVEIFGKNAPIEELASLVDTIPYEILCGISSRVKRVFLQD